MSPDNKHEPQYLELLAPAGDREALRAALDAGADAVYLGLRTLNARRRAKNFSPDEFVKAVEAAHAKGVKVYLTLNTDIAQRELGQAARMLELARQCRTEAVLVRDPAFLALRGQYPEIAFHFSTQTCMANSADVAAAAELGANRAVLAREMTLPEIAAASAGRHPQDGRGMRTEVFVQGALCFSVSGRCLLSSWIGCRSGNRGACTSPCRVPWDLAVDQVLLPSPACGKGDQQGHDANGGRQLPSPACGKGDQQGHDANGGRQLPSPACGRGAGGEGCLKNTQNLFSDNSLDQEPAETPLSMKDLSLIDRLPELRRAGVAALKIEGRLKNAAWVATAVSLYKQALAEEQMKIEEKMGTGSFSDRGPVPFVSAPFFSETAQLGAYTGRKMTGGYLDGQRDGLTAQAEGRQSENGNTDEDHQNLALSSPHPSPLPKGEGTNVDNFPKGEGTCVDNFPKGEGTCVDNFPKGEGTCVDNFPKGEGTNVDNFPKGEGTNVDNFPKGEGTNVDNFPKEEGMDDATYDLQMTVEPKGIACTCSCGLRTEQWKIPKTVIHRANKAVSIGTLFERLEQGSLQGFGLGLGETNDPGFLLTPRAVNGLLDRISGVIRLSQKAPDETVRIDLPPAVSDLLNPGAPSESNRICLGKKPDRARLDAKDAPGFLRRVRPKGVIVEGLTADTFGRIRAMCENIELIAALPQVFFEDDIPQIKKLLDRCADEGVAVEVNTWGAWLLAKSAGVKMESGPGLPVLNSLAAEFLVEKGIKCVTFSPEADRRQLEDVSAHCTVPCSMIVFGRPPLMTTRVEIPQRFLDQVLTDRRGMQIIPRREHGLYVFRPAEPFDLRALKNDRIRASHLVVDLVGSNDPLADWQNIPLPEEEIFHFNYDRTLA
jgi:collagenase-like PrtC family protease